MNPAITVFTPAYNRGYIIEKLYRSLQRQTFHDFEWIVIDDGSTDNTEALFSAWMQEENFFPIYYQKVPNGGKHRAINRGVQLAQGELFFIVDSDDCLTDDALEKAAAVERSIPPEEKVHFGGVCGRRGHPDGKELGTTFAGDYLDITMLERPKYGIAGDKAEVFYTEILRKYPFPAFAGENFITECVVWDKIAFDGYKLRFFNDTIYLCDYLPDGLTASGNKIFEHNPKGWGLYIAQSAQFGKCSGKDKWLQYLLYYRSMRSEMTMREMAETLQVNCVCFAAAMPILNMYFELRWGRKDL